MKTEKQDSETKLLLLRGCGECYRREDVEDWQHLLKVVGLVLAGLILAVLLTGCEVAGDTSTEDDSVDTSTPSVFVGDTYDKVWCLYGEPDEAEAGCWYYKRLGTSDYGAVLCFKDGILYRVRIVR